MAFFLLKGHYCTVNIGEKVCSCWVERSCSAEGRTVVGHREEAIDSSVRKTRAETPDDARRRAEKKSYLTSALQRLKERKV